MCLIAIAHRASERFPLVIAANRDEDYTRPTIPAAPWAEAPHVA
ncbi:MAG: NRDE family protein, partial [Thermoanaerobaculia bacterium]